MKKIALDANILLAILFEEEHRHEEAFASARIAAGCFKILLTPATFLICNYYIEKDYKKHKNKAIRDTLLNHLYLFDYSTENDAIIRNVQQLSFHDKEDALQYFSALHGGASALLTFNPHDFYPYAKELIIYDPIEFLMTFSA